jgi:plastocyanin
MKRAISTALAVAAILSLLVGLPAASGPEPQPATTTPEPVTPAPTSTDQPEGGQAVSSPVIGTGQPKAKSKSARHKRASKVQVAGAGSVTIKDFSYAPKSVTINVGDTVTWVNHGPTDHTATANDHSFDTGILKKGQSGSHTFSAAGTFSYFCTIHPFMKATVVVAAGESGGSGGSSGSTGSSGSASGAGRSSGTAASGSKQALPKSGVDVGSMVLSGALLLLSGLVLRRRTTGASG